MPSEDVIELSIEETNKLRAKLGLKPLRIDKDSAAVSGTGIDSSVTREQGSSDAGGKRGDEEALELSVEETNKLREKLGLAPLRTNTGGADESKKKEIHKPAENTGEQEEALQRIERAKLRRQVEDGAAKTFGTSSLGLGDEADENKNDGDDDDDWAVRMRQQTEAPAKKNKKKKKKEQSLNGQEGNYDETDLEGMQVRNSMAGLGAGEDAVLTLADAPILQTKTFVSNKVVGINEEEDALENIGFAEQEKQRDGLRKKRMLEMGMGRAGGYAGFDDDEFEELGGTLGPSYQDRGGSIGKENERRGQGFRIGSDKTASVDASKTDFDRVKNGEAISLVWKGDAVSSDYMTIEEEDELKAKRKKSKEKTKFKKKKKSKSKKKRRRADIEDDEDEDGDERNENLASVSAIGTKSEDNNLLSTLEKTAESSASSSLQKRRRTDDDDDDDDDEEMQSNENAINLQQQLKPQTKRLNYQKIMEKGNERTRKAFETRTVKKEVDDADIVDDEPDDSFLNAALAKARRLNRLREMNKASSTGASAVAEAVKSSSAGGESTKESSGISFSIDDTREFSRAIRARTQQKERESHKQKEETTFHTSAFPTDGGDKLAPKASDKSAAMAVENTDVENNEEVEDVDMEELAKEVKEDNLQSEFDGSTARSVGVGRGLSSFVSMLRTTGEITGRHGGKEELRGRAKDERNYDNYEPLDLQNVVTIGHNATEKDRELAKREIKLEYRDKHGRLLTQKEAYRDLCYQFHGHGASKKKEEKRLKQIAREQAEARMASGQVSAARDGTTVGTLGALRATQKATGKAFVVHKT
eukprot:CAMPEP_0172387498 /NCGR_PEP_ID=MMETSP1061-20121228/4792_1 /TAXON_ID=37318 /ORGANISM="Pseudo-nitzschia pungens, Strain cf. pungens" /LENGTH=814 /DNA_ID=CAMNT_0013117149 /DNA_START=140 /DNA_END=2584 /DNA_ORIENTATION=-